MKARAKEEYTRAIQNKEFQMTETITKKDGKID